MDIANNEDEVNPTAKTLEAVFRNDEERSVLSVNSAESLEKENPKNPLLLSPVIRCVLKFLNINDMKICRLVSREWGSTGKLELASRALISFSADGTGRRPADFRSCFLNSATLFSAFMVSGDFTPCGLEELAKFFGEQQIYVKELSLHFRYATKMLVNNIEFSTWISKSPMVQKDVKYLTKLSLGNIGYGSKMVVPPLHLIAHIKDLTLSNIRIDLEDRIQICSRKLKLSEATFFKEGVRMNRVRIHDIVDLNKTKDLSLQSRGLTNYVLDLSGHATLENMTLNGIQILSGESSQWAIRQLTMTNIPYSLNSLMNIKELSLTCDRDGIDLFTLPYSIQKLALYVKNGIYTYFIRCSQPIVFENLQYLHIFGDGGNRHLSPTMTDWSFLSHFGNCPQLTHLKLNRCNKIEMEPNWMPKTVKTLALQYSLINWLDDCSLKLEKLVFYGSCTFAEELCKSGIQVDDFVMHYKDLAVDKDLVGFLEYRKHCNFCKRIYIGKLKWGTGELQDYVLNEHVDSKSPFYIFENGEKGRALSETEFVDLIPKHLEILL